MRPELPATAPAFLAKAGWEGAICTPLAGDASTRQYFQVNLAAKTAILMSAPAGLETAICPPDASVQDRQNLGYTAMARLAANDCRAFVGLAQELANRGFSTPAILAADIPVGLILLEDLGKNLFAALLQQQPNLERELYENAVAVLAALTRSSFGVEFEYRDQNWPVQTYDRTALMVETALLDEWYFPFCGIATTTNLQSTLNQAWHQVLDGITRGPTGLVLRDFHAENLIWLPERAKTSNIGLLDFQDAVFGHPAYDLVSLLQDARRDVDPMLETPMIEHFIALAHWPDKAEFLTAYRILGAQRAAKILGIFVRLARRDGKSHYLSFLPRVERYFTANLGHKELAPVADILRPLLPKLFNGGQPAS
ncbi:MAG: phosphotransferase [Robiginitomaculum sp.]|nr:phosphotransferase [Robiginitomaculum sp.]